MCFTSAACRDRRNLRGYWEFWAQNRIEGAAVFRDPGCSTATDVHLQHLRSGRQSMPIYRIESEEGRRHMERWWRSVLHTIALLLLGLVVCGTTYGTP